MNSCLFLGGPNTPNTPGSANDGQVGFPAPSPKTTDSSSSNMCTSGPGSNKRFPAQSPGPRTPNDPAGTGSCGGGSRFPMPSPQSQQGMPGAQPGGPRFAGPGAGPRPENPMGGPGGDSNMPLNPSGPPTSKSGGSGPPQHFDPISSLAQMSQSLTNTSSAGK